MKIQLQSYHIIINQDHIIFVTDFPLALNVALTWMIARTLQYVQYVQYC